VFFGKFWYSLASVNSLKDYLREAREEDVTFISVSFRTADYLRLNRALQTALNPRQKIWWMVVDNTPDDATFGRVKEGDGFVLLPGVPLSRSEVETIHYGSLAHSKAVNVAMNYCRTRHVVIVDPDCFVVMQDWLDNLRDQMATKSWAFWGAPYHPERLCPFNVFGKTYMYFPTAILLCIDREQLFSRHGYPLDFVPDADPIFGKREYYHQLEAKARAVRARPHRLLSDAVAVARRHGLGGLRHWMRLVAGPFGFDRRPDIGSQVHRRYRKSGAFGWAQVSYSRRFPPLFQIWKHLVPQALVNYPKRKDYWTNRKFPGLVGELSAQGRWEQFWWNESPFAVHIGKTTYLPGSDDVTNLKRVLGDLLPPVILDQLNI
jgi:hypothetical protein